MLVQSTRKKQHLCGDHGPSSAYNHGPFSAYRGKVKGYNIGLFFRPLSSSFSYFFVSFKENSTKSYLSQYVKL